MADRKQRAIAWFFAVIFIISSSIVSVAVIYEIIQSGKNDDVAEQIKASEEAKETNVNALQGKPLAGFTPLAEVKELQIADTNPGTGDTVKEGDFITVDYTGALASTGIVFESSKDSSQALPPFELKKGSLIDGWVKGVPGMKVGGTRRLLIPSELAYGSQATGSIPANSDLVFDITVKKIGK